MKRALVIGIDHYDNNSLATCEADAKRVADLLERHENRRKNFDVKLLLSDGRTPVSRAKMMEAVKALYAQPAEMTLFYFAGHGVFDTDASSGTLLAQNGEEEGIGLALNDLTTMASAAYPKITSSVIILDCCQSGQAGNLQGTEQSSLGQGVTILASSDRSQSSASDVDGGIFTQVLLDALAGAAADNRGNIAPASVYAHVDQSLGAHDQRPIYKANVREFVSLREVEPKVPDEVLRQLPEWFPEPGHIFALDPSFEPEVKPGTEADYDAATRATNQAVFAQLQLCNRYGLITPVDEEHMYFAAMNSTGCKLTPLGGHFRKLVLKGRI